MRLLGRKWHQRDRIKGAGGSWEEPACSRQARLLQWEETLWERPSQGLGGKLDLRRLQC